MQLSTKYGARAEIPESQLRPRIVNHNADRLILLVEQEVVCCLVTGEEGDLPLQGW